MRLLLIAFIGALTVLPARAADEQASETSIRELIAVTQTKKMLDGMYTQLDTIMQAAMKNALAGHALNPGQEKVIDDMRAKLIALYQEAMAWDSFEPLIINIYRNASASARSSACCSFTSRMLGKRSSIRCRP